MLTCACLSSLFWVVTGHVYATIPGLASNLADCLTNVLGRWSMQVILQADVSVDTFFVLSGFLSAYVGLRKMEKVMNSGPSACACILLFLKAMFLRYLRLVPLLGFVIWFAAWVFPSLGNGPLWAPLMKTVSDLRKHVVN